MQSNYSKYKTQIKPEQGFMQKIRNFISWDDESNVNTNQLNWNPYTNHYQPQQFYQSSAISTIEQNQQVNIKHLDKAVLILGNTGSGKSTVFNWLKGNQLIVSQNPSRKTQWIVDTSDKTPSKIGHKQESQTQTPIIERSQNGTYLVDFPGWKDTHGWQSDLIHQCLIKSTINQFQNVSIIFVCDYNTLDLERGNSIREFVSAINNFTQGAISNKGAMLLVTKVSFSEYDEKDITDDIISQINEILDGDSELQIDESSKATLKSMLTNQPYIMEKVGLKKNLTQIKKRNIKLNLKHHFNKDIDDKFKSYFQDVFDEMRIRIQEVFKSIKEIHQTILIQNQPLQISQISESITFWKKQLEQIGNHQFKKYNALEKLYKQFTDLTRQKYIEKSKSFNQAQKIYDYFFQFQNELIGYQLQLFDNKDMNQMFDIQQDLMLFLEESLERAKWEKEKFQAENKKLLEELAKLKKEQEKNYRLNKKEYTKIKITLENNNRRWNPFKRPLIPLDIEDFDEYMKLEDELYG